MSVVSSVAAHLTGGALRRPAPRPPRRRRRPARLAKLAEHLGAALAADLDQEAVLAVVEQLGEGEVEADARRAGPVFIETQKQVPPAFPQLTATMNAPSRRAW